MSCDMLEDVEDARKNTVLLTMRASGFAQLTVMGPTMDPDVPGSVDGPMAEFDLTPDTAGLQNAQKIIDGLREWQRHMCRLNPELKVPDEGRPSG